MFNNPSNIDYNLDEGTVTEVDALRKLCKVKTLSGQNLKGVHWLQPKGGSTRGDDCSTPELGDRCVINSGLGYPLIIGYLPRLQDGVTSFPINVDSGEELVDTGDFSTVHGSVEFSQNSAGDRAVGDRIISSVGGGLFAVLRGGSLLLRSSRLSEIFLSKWDDVVRIVSRNYEHYTDVSSDFIRNLRGRVYRYTGYANNQADAKTENYKFNQYYGDVAMAEKAKTDLSSNYNPQADNRIYKEEIVTGLNGSQYMYKEIHLDGTTDLVVISPDGSLVTQVRSRNNDVFITSKAGDNSLFSQALFTKSDVTITASDSGGVFSKTYLTKDDATITVTDGSTFTKTYMTKNEARVTFKDQNVIKVNASQINMNFNGGGDINMTSDNIVSTYKGGTITMDANQINCAYSGHFMTVNNSGVQLG